MLTFLLCKRKFKKENKPGSFKKKCKLIGHIIQHSFIHSLGSSLLFEAKLVSSAFNHSFVAPTVGEQLWNCSGFSLRFCRSWEKQTRPKMSSLNKWSSTSGGRRWDVLLLCSGFIQDDSSFSSHRTSASDGLTGPLTAAHFTREDKVDVSSSK